MAQRKAGGSAACYFGGKLLGRCSPSDGEAFNVFMNRCENDAARVLREYSYFSPELKAILKKAAAMQAALIRRSDPPGLFRKPNDSPWGEVQTCDTLCPGVFLVSTEGHGGTMVAPGMQEFLSAAAKKCGVRRGGFLCFEEDCQEAVVMRELLDKGLWEIPDRIRDKAAFEENINKSLREYNPDYWRSREHGREKAAQSRPARTIAER
jgi:hypothetical protein